jgi:hypothetical protein
VTLANGDTVTSEYDHRRKQWLLARWDNQGNLQARRYRTDGIWILTPNDTGADFDAVKRLALQEAK